MVKKTISKRTDRGSEQFLLRLPDGMREHLAKVAEREGHTMSAVIVTALAMYFEKEDAASKESQSVATALKDLRDRLANQDQKLTELLKKADTGELVYDFVEMNEMNETRDYIARGRAFKGREDVEVLDLWVAAFEKLSATRTAEARLIVEDLQAELRLRKLEPPGDRIKTILEKTTAEMYGPGAENDPRWDVLERKFRTWVFAELKKPKN